MNKAPICSYCKIHKSAVYCRDACERGICYACLVCIPTAGQCKSHFEEYKDVHLKDHMEELNNGNWSSKTNKEFFFMDENGKMRNVIASFLDDVEERIRNIRNEEKKEVD